MFLLIYYFHGWRRGCRGSIFFLYFCLKGLRLCLGFAKSYSIFDILNSVV